MERADAEMMETEMAALPELASNLGENKVVRDLLALAWQLINQGRPSQVLQAGFMTVKTKGGNEAVFQSLHRARELYRLRLQETAAVDQLASLFDEGAIAEADPVTIELSPNNMVGPSTTPDARGASILAGCR